MFTLATSKPLPTSALSIPAMELTGRAPPKYGHNLCVGQGLVLTAIVTLFIYLCIAHTILTTFIAEVLVVLYILWCSVIPRTVVCAQAILKSIKET